jgi:hypothetical protein
VADEQKMDLGTVVARNDEPVAIDVDETIVMMSILQGKYYGLDEIGTRIWELIAEPRSIGAVCATLLQEFDVDEETCRRDVLDFVRELAGEKLVRVVDEAST